MLSCAWLISIFLLTLLLPLNAVSQITCFSYATMLSCDGPNNSNTLIVPFAGTNSGVIHTDQSSEPYRLLPLSTATDERRQAIIDRFE
jgi:hypothetical protein